MYFRRQLIFQNGLYCLINTTRNQRRHARLIQPVNPPLTTPINKRSPETRRTSTSDIKRVRAHNPDIHRVCALTNLLHQMRIRPRIRLETSHAIDRDPRPEQLRVRSQLSRRPHGLADHGIRAVREHIRVHASRVRLQELHRGGDLGEDVQRVVRAHERRGGVRGEHETVLRNGVGERAARDLAECPVLAWECRQLWSPFAPGIRDEPMLLIRQVYSSWYRRHNAASDWALSAP